MELDDKTGTMFAEASDIEITPLLGCAQSLGPADGQDRLDHVTLPEVGRADAVEKFSKDCQIG